MRHQKHAVLSLSIILLALFSVAATFTSAQSVPIDATAQQQTVDAVIGQYFTATAEAVRQSNMTQTLDSAFNQAVTATSAYEATVGAAFAQAQTSTTQFQATIDAGFQQAMQSTLSAGIPATATAMGQIPIQESTIDQLTQLQVVGRRSVLHGIQVSPDETTIAANGRAGIWLYRIDALDADPRVIAENSPVSTFEYSPDGRQLVTSFHNGHDINVWDVETGALTRTLSGHEGSVTSFSLSGELLASSDDANAIIVWNWQLGDQLAIIENTGLVSNVALAGDYVLVTTIDENTRENNDTVNVWNWRTNELLRTLDYTHGLQHVVVADQYAVAAAFYENELVVWNWQTGEQIQRFEHNGAQIDNYYILTSGQLLVSYSYPDVFTIWDIPTGNLAREFAGSQYTRTAVSQRYAVSLSNEQDGSKAIRVYDLQTGQILQEHIEAAQVVPRAGQFSGDFFVSGSSAWNWRTWELIRELSGLNARLLSTVLSGDYAVSGTEDALVVWNWRTGEYVRTLDAGDVGDIYDVAVSGDVVIATSFHGSVLIWNWQTGERIPSTWFLADRYYSLDGARLSGDYVINPGENGVTIINWRTGQPAEYQRLQGHAETVNAIDVFGDIVISASNDHTLIIWNWRTGERLTTLVGHTDKVKTVSIIGNYVVSGSDDNTVSVWNWRTGSRLFTTSVYAPEWIEASPEGTVFAVGSSDGSVRFWGIPNAEASESTEVGSFVAPTATSIGFDSTQMQDEVSMLFAGTATANALPTATPAPLVPSTVANDPAEALRQWFSAFVESDGVALARLTCTAMQDSLTQATTMQSLLNAFGGMDAEAGGGVGLTLNFGLEYDLTGLRFQTVSQTSTAATVSMDGEIIVSVLGVFQTVEVPTSLVQMQFEDARWKVCDMGS